MDFNKHENFSLARLTRQLRSRLVYFLTPIAILFAGYALMSSKNTPVLPGLQSMSAHITGYEQALDNSMTFCGEQVPLDNAQVHKKVMREIQRYVRHKEATAQLLHRAARYQPAFVTLLNGNGVHEDIFYMAIVESELSNAISPANASGFWQFMKEAAKQYGLEISATVDERFHPEKSTVAAARYMKDGHAQLGSWALVAGAYNMGIPGMMQAVRSQKKNSYYTLSLNSETAQYLYRALAIKAIAQAPWKYNIKLNRGLRPIAYRVVKVNQNIVSLAAFAEQQGTSLETIRHFNPWLIADRLEVTTGKTYEIRIPRNEDVQAPELKIRRPYRKNSLAATADSLSTLQNEEEVLALLENEMPADSLK